jgi:peptide alpha-N-acetyltransferase
MAVNQLPEPLPEKVQEVFQSTFLSTLPSKPLDEVNEAYLTAHKDSAPHVHAVVRVRHALQPTDEDSKKSANDLQATLKSESTSLEDAVEGLTVLGELGLGHEAKEAYRKAALERWGSADAFSDAR